MNKFLQTKLWRVLPTSCNKCIAYAYTCTHIHMCTYECRFFKIEHIFGEGNQSILLFKDYIIFLLYRLQLVH